MMRQLGGSFGVAVITTFIARANMTHRMDLIANLRTSSPVLQNHIAMMQRGFESKGMTPDVALNSAYKSLDFSVARQAMVLSYMDVFLYIGILFLICVPFILLIKERKNRKVDLSSSMH